MLWALLAVSKVDAAGLAYLTLQLTRVGIQSVASAAAAGIPELSAVEWGICENIKMYDGVLRIYGKAQHHMYLPSALRVGTWCNGHVLASVQFVPGELMCIALIDVYY